MPVACGGVRYTTNVYFYTIWVGPVLAGEYFEGGVEVVFIDYVAELDWEGEKMVERRDDVVDVGVDCS
jgi:hypothetical protein